MRKIFLVLNGEEQVAEPVVDPLIEEQAQQLLALADSNPDLVAKDPEFANLVKLAREDKTAAEAGKAEPVKQEPATKQAAKAEPAKQEPAKTETVKVEKPALPFFGKVERGDDFKDADIAKLDSIAKDKFGIDTSKPDWFKTFLSSYAEARNQASQSGVVKSELEQTKKAIDSLPRPLARAVSAALKGENWQAVIGTQTNLDYGKEWSLLTDAERRTAAAALVGEDVSKEAVDSDKLKTTLALAERHYNVNKKESDLEKQSIQQRRELEYNNFVSSVDSSLANLKQSYPQMDEDEIARIKDTISNPSLGINSLFLDLKTGNFLPDVAERVAYVLYGKDMMNAISQKSASKAKTEGKREVLQRNQKSVEEQNKENNSITAQERRVDDLSRPFLKKSDPYENKNTQA